MTAMDQAISPQTRLIAVTHVSNVLGIVNPVAEICAPPAGAGPRCWWTRRSRRCTCGRAASDVVKAADAVGIAVRAGDLATVPLLRRFGVENAAHASCYLYNTTDEIDRLVSVLRAV